MLKKTRTYRGVDTLDRLEIDGQSTDDMLLFSISERGGPLSMACLTRAKVHVLVGDLIVWLGSRGKELP